MKSIANPYDAHKPIISKLGIRLRTSGEELWLLRWRKREKDISRPFNSSSSYSSDMCYALCDAWWERATNIKFKGIVVRPQFRWRMGNLLLVVLACLEELKIICDINLIKFPKMHSFSRTSFMKLKDLADVGDAGCVYNRIFQQDLFHVEHHVAKQISCCKFDGVGEDVELDKAWRLDLSKRGMKKLAKAIQCHNLI